jgi:hypothetical protein
MVYTQVIELLPVLELPLPNPPLAKGREQYRLGINSESHSVSPLQRTQKKVCSSPLEWTFAMSLEL